ncbi:MASE3 domain-containing protein [Candidatus Magnetomonas plexicatena]|uniref:MASE3 domain-containing protein n=1 Tax=Candidatus Magnetomonas plexicatena TaxID=2552947 RepID=UPI001101600B|nr:response regulator [Nitrospirales bacterium LBB_01]
MKENIAAKGNYRLIRSLPLWGVVITALYLTSLSGFLVFHTLAELFCVIIAFCIFILSWNTRRYMQNNYLFFIGISYFFIGSLDLVHTLTYEGMTLIHVHSAGATIEIWISVRYIESISLFIAPLLLYKKRLRAPIIFSGYVVVTLMVFVSVFVLNNFPECYEKGVGLTSFKKNSEYIICCILVVSLILLYRKRSFFDKEVLRLSAASISFAILTELCFTFYVGLYDEINMVGHFFKVFSYYFIYRAIVVTGLNKPFDLLFRTLKISEDSLQKMNTELERRVEQRTTLLLDEIAERKKIEISLARLNRVYAVVSETTHLIVHVTNTGELMDKICKVGVEQGSFMFVTIIRYNEYNDTLEPVAFSGHTENYTNSATLVSNCDDKDSDPVKRTIQTGSFYICNDIISNETCTERKEEAISQGYQSYAVFPLKVFEKNEGVIMFYSGEPDFFSEEEILLLDELSRDVSYALENMEKEKIKNQIEQQNKALEEQLVRSQKMEVIGQLSGGIAHDFNNILFSITNYIYLMLKNLDESHPLRKYAEGIQLASEKASNLTRSLLAFSRKQIIQTRVVNLNDVISHIEPILRRLIPEETELRVELTDDDTSIMADPSQLEQVLLNLITNAKDSMLAGGFLIIKTTVVQLDKPYIGKRYYDVKGPYALLAVTDTGCGMDAEVMSRIYEPFYTTKEIGKGTGLGLSTVYGIVKQHNGLINVYSEPELGTSFKVFFPLANTRAERLKASEKSEVKGGDETILIVEDDSEVRRIVVELLQDAGYKTIEIQDGQEAVETYKKRSGEIHMVILDVIMPKMNGEQAYDKMRDVKPSVKTLFMSGFSFDVLSKRETVPENFDFISKPLFAEEFLSKVREILDK